MFELLYIINGDFMKINPEMENIDSFAKVLLTAARTAPKAKGIDNIVTGILDENDREKVADYMDKIAEEKGGPFGFFKRDADNLRNSNGCIVIGVKSNRGEGLNCGMCGMTCADMANRTKSDDYNGPICGFKIMDLGIALGSAGAKAKDMCIDNRMMYTVGLAVKKMGLLDADVVIGMPLSVKGKNPFFDRIQKK